MLLAPDEVTRRSGGPPDDDAGVGEREGAVAEVADHLGRTLHATEALLVRAKAAFRKAYREEDDRG